MNNYKDGPYMFPLAPPGGGYLVLTESQISNFDLLCAIKTIYPNTRIIAQQMIPIETDRHSR
jgi:hypothetical protein